MTPEIILHYNQGSPYSARAKLQLSYTGLDWRGCLTSKDMPRPALSALVGTYSRRVPLLQIGADLYCDAAGIAAETAERASMPELSPFTIGSEEQKLLNYIELTGNTAILSNFGLMDFLKGYFSHLPCRDAVAFFKDRKALIKTYPKLKELRNNNANKKILDDYLTLINARLAHHQYLSNKDIPSAVDFAAYTMIWYQDLLTHSRLISPYKHLQLWFKEITTLQHEDTEDISAEAALFIAKSSSPKPIPQQYQRVPTLGKEVNLIPNDPMGKVLELPISGLLVGESEQKFIIAQQNEAVGTVHIHLPKLCFGACG